MLTCSSFFPQRQSCWVDDVIVGWIEIFGSVGVVSCMFGCLLGSGVVISWLIGVSDFQLLDV